MAAASAGVADRIRTTLLPRPGTERPPHYYQLAEMVGRVVCDQEKLAQVSLLVTGRNFREEIDSGIEGQLLQCLPILPDGRHALVPGSCRRWRGALGPVIDGPVELLVGWISAELQNVVLGNTDVLQQLPGRVGEAARRPTSKIRWQGGHDFLETRVGVLPIQQLCDCCAYCVGRGHTVSAPRLRALQEPVL